MKTRHANNRALLIGLLCVWQAASLLAQNLLINGSFEAGNTGFSSDYTYAPGNLGPEGTYDVSRNPRDSHALAASFTDHTSGTGFMLVVNGAADTNRVVWRQSVGLTMNTPYEFSGWAASWGNDGTGHDPNPARFRLSINGSAVGPAFQLSNLDGQWQGFSVPWSSIASGSALIELRLETAALIGNDPAFDDLALVAVPEPKTMALIGLGIVVLVTRRLRPNKSLQPTPGRRCSSAARFTSPGPAWLSSDR